MIVADTNVIASLLIAGDRTSDARRAYRRDPAWAAPLLWRSELRSVLAQSVRHGAFDAESAIDRFRLGEELVRGRQYEVDAAAVLRAAVSSGCSVYDCEFVVLSRDLRARLVTADHELLRAFPDVAVSLAAFARG